MNKKMHWARVACLEPDIIVGNVLENARTIWRAIDKLNSEDKNIDVFVLPELALTGYTCADMFNTGDILDNIEKGIEFLCANLGNISCAFIGTPLIIENKLYNCVLCISQGEIKGVVPKTYLPNYNEFYEARWFTSGNELNVDKVRILNKSVPIGSDLIFTLDELKIAVDVCEDLWVQIPPSSYTTMCGANLVVNCSASNELIGKAEYRRELIKSHSAKCICAYAYCSAGSYESTTDLVFSGHRIIAENGKILSDTIWNDSEAMIMDVDLEVIRNDRLRQTSFISDRDVKCREIMLYYVKDIYYNDYKWYRSYDKYPFVPSSSNIHERAETIMNIQAQALAHRFKQTNSKHAIIGVSGGLDSTLALLVVVRAFNLLGKPISDIYGITMPCYGTSNRTYNNAVDLMALLGCTTLECPIKEAVEVHFRDIAQNPSVHDITYENAQARERTQILMDYANKVGGLVIGTGDLSELALGWCTYNGDHMSMYGVNSSIPKTLVKFLVESEANYYESINKSNIKDVLTDICDTPISPELLPTDKDGEIKQETESVIGKYDLNDFFLFYLVRHRFSIKKIYAIASNTYPDRDVKTALQNFIRRFYSQQFKRSCLPDGIKVGSVSLSPRGDWRCPSDLSREAIDNMLKVLE